MLRESVAECERARTLDPGVKLYSSALNAYLYLGQYDKFLKSLPEDSDSPYPTDDPLKESFLCSHSVAAILGVRAKQMRKTANTQVLDRNAVDDQRLPKAVTRVYSA